MDIFGTRFDDRLTATSPDDVLFGRGGDDRLRSEQYLADINGGNGDDRIQYEWIERGGTGVATEYTLRLSGGNGNDQINARTSIGSSERDGSDGVVLRQEIDGGRGDDRISVTNGVGLGGDIFGPRASARTVVTDLSGDNRVEVRNILSVEDSSAFGRAIIKLGAGDDVYRYTGFNEAGPNGAYGGGQSVNMGHGNNKVYINERGDSGIGVVTGRDDDFISINYAPDDGNDSGIRWGMSLDTGNGDDVVRVNVRPAFIDMWDARIAIDLGGGDNRLDFDMTFAGNFDITAKGGSDRIFVDMRSTEYDGDAVSYRIDAGGGNNNIRLNTGEGGGVSEDVAVDIVTGNGADFVLLGGDASDDLDTRTINTGGGNDKVWLETGNVRVTLGEGADSVRLNSTASFGTVSRPSIVEITDFSLNEGDNFYFQVPSGFHLGEQGQGWYAVPENLLTFAERSSSNFDVEIFRSDDDLIVQFERFSRDAVEIRFLDIDLDLSVFPELIA